MNRHVIAMLFTVLLSTCAESRNTDTEAQIGGAGSGNASTMRTNGYTSSRTDISGIRMIKTAT